MRQHRSTLLPTLYPKPLSEQVTSDVAPYGESLEGLVMSETAIHNTHDFDAATRTTPWTSSTGHPQER